MVNPPTPANARTGEFTPPGIWALACLNSNWLVVALFELFEFMGLSAR